jgi:hypothetical protein
VVQQVQKLPAGTPVSTDRIIEAVRRRFSACEHTDDDLIEMLVGIAGSYSVPVLFDHNDAGRRPSRHVDWPRHA